MAPNEAVEKPDLGARGCADARRLGLALHRYFLRVGPQNVIPAMNRLLTGANTGKVIVKLAS